MSLKETINKDIKTAMLAREKEQLKALRSIKALILLAESEKGATGELSPEKEIALLNRAAKQRKESADIFLQQQREDLALQEKKELEVILNYLPAMMSEEEVEKRLRGIIQTSGASGLGDLGKVMGLSMQEMNGKADGRVISDLAKKILSEEA